MRTESQLVYKTDDGKTFLDEKEAKKHENRLKHTRAYHVRYAPDLTEKGNTTEDGYIVCTAKWSNELWVEDWLYQKFGNRVAFVQGVSPTINWSFTKVDIKEVDDSKLLVQLDK